MNDQNLLDIQAWIQGPTGTPFEGGCFKVQLRIGSNYPTVAPLGLFLTRIFHPNVSAAGEICVSTLKKDWRSDLGIKHLLLTIKCLLIVPNPESALNEEAGKLLLEDYSAYARKASLITAVHAPKASDVGFCESEQTNVSSGTINSTPTDANTNESPKKRTAGSIRSAQDKKRTLRRL